MASFEKKPLGKTGLAISALGFGTGPLGWRDETVDDDELNTIFDDLVAHGVNYFDTAPMYGFGRAERRLGRMLANRPHAGMIVSTKVGRLLRPDEPGHSDDPVIFDYGADAAWRSIEESLERLKRGSVDIALIHDIDRRTHGSGQPERFRQALEGAYVALAAMKEQGLVRAIGLGVNEWQVCRDFAARVPVDCFMLAGQHSLLNRTALHDFLPWCAQRGIGLMIAGPFNSGILAKGAQPGARYDYRPASAEMLARVQAMDDICARHHVSLPAAALAFCAKGPAVASVVVGAASARQVRQTLGYAGEIVPQALWTDLARFLGDRQRM